VMRLPSGTCGETLISEASVKASERSTYDPLFEDVTPEISLPKFRSCLSRRAQGPTLRPPDGGRLERRARSSGAQQLLSALSEVRGSRRQMLVGRVDVA
jgi:hypothetical protein